MDHRRKAKPAEAPQAERTSATDPAAVLAQIDAEFLQGFERPIDSLPVRAHPPSRAEQADKRARIIAALGWKPEGETREDSYAATTGEMLTWLREGVAKRGSAQAAQPNRSSPGP